MTDPEKSTHFKKHLMDPLCLVSFAEVEISLLFDTVYGLPPPHNLCHLIGPYGSKVVFPARKIRAHFH